VQPYLDQRCARIVDAVSMAAEGLGVLPVAVALAWVRDRPGIVCPVIGARTLTQLAGSLGSEQLTLPQDVRAALDEVSAPR
jgi:aryl-alcohol dehydrogenase-like predicted oxidoreductase